MIKSDFHTHTVFCDGRNTAEEMILSAVEKGLEAYGFSGHSFLHNEKWCMPLETYDIYRAEIERLKDRYGEKIHIFCGIEQDYNTEQPAENFDYVIGSVHSITAGVRSFFVDSTPQIFVDGVNECFDGDFYSAAAAYFDTVSRVADKTNCDIIGHFDLITKFNEDSCLFDITDRRYVEPAIAAADELLKKDVIFEVNTGAISRGWRSSAYPELFLMEYLAEHGARFILSSDTHATGTIAYKFDEYEDLFISRGWTLERFTPEIK